MANDFVGYLKETTFGAKPALSNVEFCNVLSENLRGQRTFETEMGTFYSNLRDPVTGRFQTSGSVRWQLGPENGIGKCLQAMLGADTATDVGAVGSSIQHVWNDAAPAQSPPSMTIMTTRAYQLAQFDYVGQVCSRIRLEGVPNQSVRAEAEFVGDYESINASPDTPTIPSQIPFYAHESDWRIGSTPGTVETRVEGWSLEVSRATEITPSISTIRGRRQYSGGLTITGRADIDFDTLAYYKRFYGADTDITPQDNVTVRNVEIDITSVANAAPEASFPYRLLIRMPKIVFTGAEANQTGRDRITGGFPFKAYFDTTAGFSIQFTLINTRATTYYA